VTVVPSLSYKKVIRALKRAGFTEEWQTGSHIHMQKRTLSGERIPITVPAYRPIPRWLLSKILKQAGLTLQEFLDYL
jgi:predicted RNA binding protein YcfA (HicA-like mRNA interferase family)